jgi:hypothetical protein
MLFTIPVAQHRKPLRLVNVEASTPQAAAEIARWVVQHSTHFDAHALFVHGSVPAGGAQQYLGRPDGTQLVDGGDPKASEVALMVGHPLLRGAALGALATHGRPPR